MPNTTTAQLAAPFGAPVSAVTLLGGAAPPAQFLDCRLDAKFWDKVTPEPNTGCWLWTASVNQGYGVLYPQGRHMRAHRVAYVALVGPVPAGLVLDHLCRERSCVNPAHLEAVTNAENVRRGARTITHCPQGHEYTPENTYVYQHKTIDGGYSRFCRTCQAACRRRRELKRSPIAWSEVEQTAPGRIALSVTHRDIGGCLLTSEVRVVETDENEWDIVDVTGPALDKDSESYLRSDLKSWSSCEGASYKDIAAYLEVRS